jgi:hypothetical protein
MDYMLHKKKRTLKYNWVDVHHCLDNITSKYTPKKMVYGKPNGL